MPAVDWIKISRLFLIAYLIGAGLAAVIGLVSTLISLAILIVVAVPFWIASIKPLASLTVTELGSSVSSVATATLLSVADFALKKEAFLTILFNSRVLVSIPEFSLAFTSTALLVSEIASVFTVDSVLSLATSSVLLLNAADWASLVSSDLVAVFAVSVVVFFAALLTSVVVLATLVFASSVALFASETVAVFLEDSVFSVTTLFAVFCFDSDFCSEVVFSVFAVSALDFSS